MLNLFLFLMICAALIDLLFIVAPCPSFETVTEERHSQKNRNFDLSVVLSVIDEANNVDKAVSFIDETLGEEITQCILVCTARERNSEGRNPTFDAANRAIVGKTKFKVIEEPRKSGFKAHQVNYAIDHLASDPESTWVLLLDIDTRFTKESSVSLVKAINNGHQIIQQHSDFLKDATREMSVPAAAGLYQSRWTLAHEIPRIWLNKRLGVCVYHLVGHGLCINIETLQRLGGFSEKFEIEDIHLGFVACLEQESAFSLPTFETSDNPLNFIDWWWQQYWWSRGVMLAPVYFNEMFLTRRPSLRSYFLLIFAVWNYVRWILHSPALWVLSVSCIFLGGPYLLAFCLFWLIYLSSFLAAARVWKRAGRYTYHSFRFTLFGAIYSLIRSAPIIHSFLDVILRVKREKYKTRHE